MFDNFLKLIPTQISTAWLAPVFAIVFACWKFFREQKRLEETVEVEKTKVVKLEAALEQQKRSNELLHQGLLEMQQHKEQLDTLLADARSQIRAVADSIIIRNPYSDQALVFLIAHGPAAQSVVKMQIDLHGSQAGEVYLSRKTSIYSPAMVNKAHEK
jgi:exonuclease VII small subunit